jgi:ABC-type molybdenum transport system ATPase subunit/photorepair protein PhrA
MAHARCLALAVLMPLSGAWQAGSTSPLTMHRCCRRTLSAQARVIDPELGFGGAERDSEDSPARGFDLPARGFGSSPSAGRGFGSCESAPRGFGAWREEDAKKADDPAPQMTAEERELWKRKVLQRWSKIVQEGGGGLDAEGGEVLARMSNVTVRFGDRLVLSPQSWLVRRGQRLGVLGESGCGKSLQLRLLAGEAVPSGGSVVVEDSTRVELVDQDAPSRLHASQASLREYAASRLRRPTSGGTHAPTPSGEGAQAVGTPGLTPSDVSGTAESDDAQWRLLLQTLPEDLRTPHALGSKLCSFSHGQLVRVRPPRCPLAAPRVVRRALHRALLPKEARTSFA